MANTTNFAVEKPAVGGYRNSWGGTLNTGLDKLDALLAEQSSFGQNPLHPLQLPMAEHGCSATVANC